MRIALHSVLHEEAVDDYRAQHARIPDDLLALFECAAIHEWTIWRSGRELFHLVECDDFDTAMRIIDPDPVNARWQAHIGRFVAAFHGPDGEDAFAPLEEIWQLTKQRPRKAG